MDEIYISLGTSRIVLVAFVCFLGFGARDGQQAKNQRLCLLQLKNPCPPLSSFPPGWVEKGSPLDSSTIRCQWADIIWEVVFHGEECLNGLVWWQVESCITDCAGDVVNATRWVRLTVRSRPVDGSLATARGDGSLSLPP